MFTLDPKRLRVFLIIPYQYFFSNSTTTTSPRPDLSSMLKQVAIVSSSVIKMIANEQQQDPGVLADKLRMISPNYFKTRSKIEQLRQDEIKLLSPILQKLLQRENHQKNTETLRVTPNYFKHLLSVDNSGAVFLERLIVELKKQKNQGELAEKLNTLKPHSQLTNLSSQSVQQVKKLFTTGVHLSKGFKEQERVSRTKNINSMFVFQPTWTITSNLFNSLTTIPLELVLFSGSFGTGKTFSFIFFCQLLEKIVKYAVQAKESEIQRLVNEKIILKPIKPFYWSFKICQQQDLNRIILDQCPQLFIQNKKFYEDLLNLPLRTFIRRVRLFYQSRNIQTLLIIDQINKLAAKFREYNNKPDKQKSQLKEIQSLNKIRETLAGLGKYVIYNSSVTIQNDLLGKPMNSSLVTMDIQNHIGILTRVRIPYQDRINTEKGVQDIAAFAKFIAIQKGLTLNNLDETIIQEYIRKAQNRNFIKVMRFFERINKAQQLKTSIHQVVKESSETFRQLTQRFLVKLEQSKGKDQIEVLGLIFSKLMLMLKEDKEKFVISKKEAQEIANEIGIKEKKLKELMDKNIFAQKDGSYQCLTSKKWISQFIHAHFTTFYLKYLRQARKTFNIYLENQPIFGCIFEICFLQACWNGIKKNRSINIAYGTQKYIMLRQVSSFVALNKVKGDEKKPIINYMKRIFTCANQNPQCTVFGIPLNRDSMDKSDSQIQGNIFSYRLFNSVCVDFCFVSYQQSKETYNVTFFNIKTGGFAGIQEKTRKFDVLLKSSFVGKYNAQVKYIVFCSEAHFPKEDDKNINSQIQISYIDLSSIKFQHLLEKDKENFEFIMKEFQQGTKREAELKKKKKQQEKIKKLDAKAQEKK